MSVDPAASAGIPAAGCAEVSGKLPARTSASANVSSEKRRVLFRWIKIFLLKLGGPMGAGLFFKYKPIKRASRHWRAPFRPAVGLFSLLFAGRVIARMTSASVVVLAVNEVSVRQVRGVAEEFAIVGVVQSVWIGVGRALHVRGQVATEVRAGLVINQVELTRSRIVGVGAVVGAHPLIL